MKDKLPLIERVKISYKKLKASVYFDKTLLPLRDDIVAFERADLDEKLSKLTEYLNEEDEQVWLLYSNVIIDEISALVYPKKLKDHSDTQIIFNADSEEIQMEKAQYFINLPVEGHIIGVLWVLTVGIDLDDRSVDDRSSMYEHSYGNRLRKTLVNPIKGDITYSPNLFESYFSQYESWRDIALQQAKTRLDKKQDALVLTLDLKSFYYSVHIQKDVYDNIIKKYDSDQDVWIRRIHAFVYRVLEKYSRVVSEISSDSELQISGRIVLPIGFLPSCILSNWVLTPFDDAIIRRINPVYYGRYVDDIIIVDKVEKNSPLRKKAQESGDDKLTTQDVINYYFRACASDRTVPDDDKCGQELFLAVPEGELTEKQLKALNDAQRSTDRSEREAARVFRINPNILSPQYEDIRPDIQIQNGKVKVFYFHEGETRALLDCFRTKIGQNASEFRFLPDMDRVLDKNDYSEIFQLSSTESPHKLRGVSGVAIDKFSLSKFLGKFRKVGNLIRDKKENSFERDLCVIMNSRVLIENYTLWERLLEIMVVNERYDIYVKLVKNIVFAISKLKITADIVCQDPSIDYRQSLVKFLRSAIVRTTSLCWGRKIDEILKEIDDIIHKLQSIEGLDLSLLVNLSLTSNRKQYCISKMINKYVMPLPISCLHESIYVEKKKHIRLTRLEDAQEYIDRNWENERYAYFPYMVTPQELSYALACCDIAQQRDIANPAEQHKLICTLYKELNYPTSINNNPVSDFDEKALVFEKVDVNKICNTDQTNRALHYISVDADDSHKLRVAVGNARLFKDDFKHALTGRANRTHARYQQLTKIVRSAIEENVELLVLPENYLPWEWVPDISRLCATNQMALVSGVEHIVSRGDEDKPGFVYNLTTVMLPYQHEEYKYSHVVYHQKVHYSPEEKRMITGYRFVPKPATGYQLFQWKDVWFSVYCCYELASIHDRALFKSVADLTIAVEWNKDTNFFSSIIESMCRDIHCYIIQANSSDYGDSRVISPAKTEIRDIIKTKGGLNSTILIDQIDIQALRDYQYMEYELQRQNEQFKPTPPQFNHLIIEHKSKKTLRSFLREKGLPI